MFFFFIFYFQYSQGCVFTKDINKAILISDAMETGTVQINSAPARGPDHFPFQVTQTYLQSNNSSDAIFKIKYIYIYIKEMNMHIFITGN